jgi:hypothetical protein
VKSGDDDRRKQLLQRAFDRVVRVLSQRVLQDEELYDSLYRRVMAIIAAQLQVRSAPPQRAQPQPTAGATAATTTAVVSYRWSFTEQRISDV